MKMKKIDRKNAVFSMDKKNEATMIVDAGEVILFETSDCYNGQICSENIFLHDADFAYTNPATGPIFVKDAMPGDILKVEIIDIKVNDTGTMSVAPNYGIAGENITENRTKIIKIENDIAKFDENIEIKINPMIGVIGTAPSGEAIGNVVPDYHGGNMDCKKIVKNAIVLLPVNVEGGLLSIGDLHAVMADGEVCGCGLEIDGEVKVRVDVIKNRKLPLPMVVDAEHIMCLSSKKTLDEAVIEVTKNMHKLLIDYNMMESADASMLLSLVGELRICQIVDPLKTVRMELPRNLMDINKFI
jgi:amidase